MDGQNVTTMGQVSGAANGAQATAAATANETELGQEKTFTKEEIDRRVDEAVKTARANWDAEFDGKLKAAKDEGARLAKLSAEERQKEETKAEREQFEREKAEFAHKSLVAETVKQLGEKGIPVVFAKMAAGASAEEAQENIKTMEAEWNKAVEEAVTRRLSAKAPNVSGGAQMSAGSGFFETIKQNQRI